MIVFINGAFVDIFKKRFNRHHAAKDQSIHKLHTKLNRVFLINYEKFSNIYIPIKPTNVLEGIQNNHLNRMYLLTNQIDQGLGYWN